MRYRKSAHSMYFTEYHLVWIPRYRHRIFRSGVKEYAYKLLKNVPNLEPDIEVIKLNVQEDHVHMVIIIPPRRAVSSVVQYIKSQSGKYLRERFPFLQKVYYGRSGIWSRGYCVSSVGLNEKEILRYVEFQEKEDKGQLQLTL